MYTGVATNRRSQMLIGKVDIFTVFCVRSIFT
jgi:hypothetical protein